MKKFLITALALILLSLPVSISSNIGEPKGFLGTAFTNTVALYATVNNKDHFDCSAAIYESVPNKLHNEYHVISAGHCVQDIPVATFSIADNVGGKLTPVTLMKVRDDDTVGIDFAQFDLVTDKTYPVISLGDESTLRVGDSIINPNFAEGLGKQLSIGLVSSQSLAPTTYCKEESCRDSFIIQTFGAGGSSGSVVISKKTHKVVGVVTAEIADDDGQIINIGMIVEPISRFQIFLQQPTQDHPAPKDANALIEEIIKSITGK